MFPFSPNAMSLITPLPTASEVRADSRLSPENISRSFTSADLDDDIEVRIQEQANVVGQRLMVKALPYAWPFSADVLTSAYPKYTNDQRGAVTVRQMETARMVIKLFALASLYMTAGQLKQEYMDRLVVYQQRGESLLKTLESEVQYIASNQTGTSFNSKAATLNTGNGDLTPIDPQDVGWYPI